MKERPILFSAPMVRAILDGRKTQTRRPLSMQPPTHAVSAEVCNCPPGSWGRHGEEWHFRRGDGVAEWHTPCPHGAPRDQLWVREAVCIGRPALPSGMGIVPARRGGRPGDKVVYRADWRGDGQPSWRPSIHMPRWASRITLELTGVRVERLAGISWDDAVAEGWPGTDNGAVRWFKALWDSINAKRGYGWETNPWVWVLEFRRLP